MMDRIAIIGAGLMGHGLALVFARAGHPVTITDPLPEARRHSAGPGGGEAGGAGAAG